MFWTIYIFSTFYTHYFNLQLIGLYLKFCSLILIRLNYFITDNAFVRHLVCELDLMLERSFFCESSF